MSVKLLRQLRSPFGFQCAFKRESFVCVCVCCAGSFGSSSKNADAPDRWPGGVRETGAAGESIECLEYPRRCKAYCSLLVCLWQVCQQIARGTVPAFCCVGIPAIDALRMMRCLQAPPVQPGVALSFAGKIIVLLARFAPG